MQDNKSKLGQQISEMGEAEIMRRVQDKLARTETIDIKAEEAQKFGIVVSDIGDALQQRLHGREDVMVFNTSKNPLIISQDSPGKPIIQIIDKSILNPNSNPKKLVFSFQINPPEPHQAAAIIDIGSLPNVKITIKDSEMAPEDIRSDVPGGIKHLVERLTTIVASHGGTLTTTQTGGICKQQANWECGLHSYMNILHDVNEKPYDDKGIVQHALKGVAGYSDIIFNADETVEFRVKNRDGVEKRVLEQLSQIDKSLIQLLEKSTTPLHSHHSIASPQSPDTKEHIDQRYEALKTEGTLDMSKINTRVKEDGVFDSRYDSPYTFDLTPTDRSPSPSPKANAGTSSMSNTYTSSLHTSSSSGSEHHTHHAHDELTRRSQPQHQETKGRV